MRCFALRMALPIFDLASTALASCFAFLASRSSQGLASAAAVPLPRSKGGAKLPRL